MPRNIEDSRFEEDISTFISIPKLAKRWDASRSMIYNKVLDGVIPARRLGDRWFIMMDFVKHFENADGTIRFDLGGGRYGK